jgi:hypothetical protein
MNQLNKHENELLEKEFNGEEPTRFEHTLFDNTVYKKEPNNDEIFVIRFTRYKISGKCVYIEKQRFIPCTYIGEPPKEKYWELTPVTPQWVRKMSKLWAKTISNAIGEFNDKASKVKK